MVRIDISGLVSAKRVQFLVRWISIEVLDIHTLFCNILSPREDRIFWNFVIGKCFYIIVIYNNNMHLIGKLISHKYFNKNNIFNKNKIIPFTFSVFSIIFVGYILVNAIGHYIIKNIF